LDWGEGYRPLGRQAVTQIIEDQMAVASTAILISSKQTTSPIGAMATIGGAF
jgi:hypothetical protein